jgi:hypothetical protein
MIPRQSVTLKNKSKNVEDASLLSTVNALSEKFHPKPVMLLVQAPQFLFQAIDIVGIKNKAYYAYPPTGLQWLKKYLEGSGIDIRIFDLNYTLLKTINEDPNFKIENWLNLLDVELEKVQPSFVGVTCLSAYKDLFAEAHPLTDILKYVTKYNKYITIAGGPTATNEIDGYLTRKMAHFVIENEGEVPLRYLMNLFFNFEDVQTSAGIYYLKGKKIIKSKSLHSASPFYPPDNLISTYAEIPVESYNLIGCLNPYSRMSGQDKQYGVFQINRGCRCNCKFCGVRSFMGKGVRPYAANEILKEISYLVKERGVRHFEVLDDDFLSNPEIVIAVLEGLVKLHEEFGITWSANNGFIAYALTNQIMDLIAHSGCLGFKVGIESGNPQMLRRIRKPGTRGSFFKSSKKINKYESLFIGGNYIIGFFGEETFGMMLDTFSLAHELQFDWSSFTIFQVTSKHNAEQEGLKRSKGATDFIPSKESSNRDVWEKSDIPMGLDIFSMDQAIIPEGQLLNNIWLTFNLVSNYICNKNLLAGGDPDKFRRWVDAVNIAYPLNPYMPLFSAVSNVLLGNKKEAIEKISISRQLVEQSESWKDKFRKFNLYDLLINFSMEPTELKSLLQVLQQPFIEQYKKLSIEND